MKASSWAPSPELIKRFVPRLILGCALAVHHVREQESDFSRYLAGARLLAGGQRPYAAYLWWGQLGGEPAAAALVGVVRSALAAAPQSFALGQLNCFPNGGETGGAGLS